MRSDAVNYGENAENAKRRDDRFVRCARCGFICHLDRDVHAPRGSRAGWGIKNTLYNVGGDRTYDSSLHYDEGTSYGYEENLTYDQDTFGGSDLDYDGSTSTYTYDDVVRTIYDPVRTGGCPFCGTFLYNQ